MARKRCAAEEFIGHLRTIEIETGRGLGIAEAEWGTLLYAARSSTARRTLAMSLQ